jgi:hypothetical protein
MAEVPTRDLAFDHDVSALFSFIKSASPPRISERRYDPAAFGNAVVVLAGDAIQVRVTRERSQLLVDLSPPDCHDWVDDQVVL